MIERENEGMYSENLSTIDKKNSRIICQRWSKYCWIIPETKSSQKLYLVKLTLTAFIIYEPNIILGCLLSNSSVSFKLPNFLRASYIDDRTQTHETIVKNTLLKFRRNYLTTTDTPPRLSLGSKQILFLQNNYSL